jgi:hypothetical protein
MKKMKLILVLAFLAWSSKGFAQSDMKETVVMIKTSLVQSKEKVKQYSRIETTKVYIQGKGQ